MRTLHLTNKIFLTRNESFFCLDGVVVVPSLVSRHLRWRDHFADSVGLAARDIFLFLLCNGGCPRYATQPYVNDSVSIEANI